MNLPPDLARHLDAMGVRVVTSKPPPEVATPWRPECKGDEPPF